MEISLEQEKKVHVSEIQCIAQPSELILASQVSLLKLLFLPLSFLAGKSRRAPILP